MSDVKSITCYIRLPPYTEKDFSKMDLFYKLDVYIDDSGQRQVTIVF